MIDGRIISIFVETWNEMSSDHVREDTINCGWCYQIALVFQRLYGGLLYTPGWNHAWVKIGDLHFDTEFLRGTSNPNFLCHLEASAMDEKEFIEVWSKRGNSGKVRMDIIDEVVRRYQEEAIAA